MEHISSKDSTACGIQSENDDVFDIATENRCRSILVRYCAHVPRNFQYRDGVQVVFLILRDHIGDRDLGIAGGVLYELIEVDCAHSDDPGAGFQRWRRDHMNRHADFDLPHIPHLTTVTSSIKPSSILSRWRWDHPSRYPIRLSDAGVNRCAVSNPSCLKSRKAWTIEHTMYMSTRDSGTSIFRSISPTRFHRLHWNLERNDVGRLVAEKEFMPTISDEETGSRETRCISRMLSSLGVSPNTLSCLVNLFRNLCDSGESTGCGQPPLATMSREKRVRPSAPTTTASQDTAPGFLGGNHVIPHPMFARKHSLVSKGRPLPASMATHLMRTADSVSSDMTSTSTSSAHVFRGPFTPQLGFDGGHDFEWDTSLPPAPASAKARTGRLASRRKDLESGTTQQTSRRHNARSAHDWFGLDAGEPEPRYVSTAGPMNKRLPTHGYNWFGLD
ncbi:hypothetical protein F5X68DRAFT_213053 [Plectosphaerella plurivora]|uniref:Uncharacterized protein n=1 Tax=Plectosphaerella plurivora TaxID=936078 RepID=A0A9P8V4E0_9PEZI|nr:hypothetical protein F5X68DRAFT_213053 [Plectosphaerella plurivora]